MPRLNVNGKAMDYEAEADTPLLWVLREQLGLTGTKYGCGIAQCGSCTVHIDGAPVRSCVMPAAAVQPTQKITTIEGLSADGATRVQKAWVALDVPQCGYCQSGMIMAAAALLKDKPKPTDADIDAGDDQHLPLRHLQPRARGHQAGRRPTRTAALDIIHVVRSTRHEHGRSLAAPRRTFPGHHGRGAGGRLFMVHRLPHPRRGAGPPRPRSTPGSWCSPTTRVIIRIARSEMGQGTLTGLAQLVAEELECDWSRVTTEYPTPGQNLARKRVWGNFSTGGSRGIRESHDYVRKGGAAARMMLVQAAADEWKVPAWPNAAPPTASSPHGPSGRSTTYGKVAAAAAKLTPPADVTLKDPKDWKLAGKRMARLDTVDKTTGRRSTAPTSSCPACSTPPSRTARCSAARSSGFDAGRC